MENQITAIIKKMRKMFSFGEYAEIMKQTATIAIDEEEDGTFSIVSIEFNYYNSIVFNAYAGGIYYEPEHGYSKQLMAFSSIEDFLN